MPYAPTPEELAELQKQGRISPSAAPAPAPAAKKSMDDLDSLLEQTMAQGGQNFLEQKAKILQKQAQEAAAKKESLFGNPVVNFVAQMRAGGATPPAQKIGYELGQPQIDQSQTVGYELGQPQIDQSQTVGYELGQPQIEQANFELGQPQIEQAAKDKLDFELGKPKTKQKKPQKEKPDDDRQQVIMKLLGRTLTTETHPPREVGVVDPGSIIPREAFRPEVQKFIGSALGGQMLGIDPQQLSPEEIRELEQHWIDPAWVKAQQKRNQGV